MLGLFGGHIETGESPEEAMKRELTEETSLDVSNLTIDYVADAELPHPNDPTVMRKIYFYKTPIDSVDFEVFEGVGSETYSTAELRNRRDLALSTKYFLSNLTA